MKRGDAAIFDSIKLITMYDKYDIERVNKADIRDFVPEVSGTNSTLFRACPECGASGKRDGLVVTHKGTVNIAKCFHCGFTLKGPIEAVKYFDGVTFPEAVKRVAERAGIMIESIEERDKRLRQNDVNDMPFYMKQLAASGLTEKDVAIVFKDNTTGQKVSLSPFRAGTILRTGRVTSQGKDMLIFYYDLNGEPEKYTRPDGTLADYVRVRWAEPDQHLNTDGKPVRYQTPKGASCKLYIPQRIREAYNKGEQLDMLFVTEGEKKAEKACKHGIMAVGIQGIFNIGNKQDGLLETLILLIEKCQPRHVALLLDSDWNDLSSKLHVGARIDNRPNQFSKAVIKFRDYMKTLHNRGLNVDVYFAYVRDNERHDKGVDDLLVGTLRGREDTLKKDVERALNAHNGQAEFVDIHKITALSDFQIRDFWSLNNHEDFYRQHKDELRELASFRIGGVSYTVEDGKLKTSFNCASDNEIWQVNYKNDGRRDITFDYFEGLEFIKANGFIRTAAEWLGKGEYVLARIEDGIVRQTAETQIRTFVFTYVQRATKDRDVISLFIRGLGKFLSKEVLERLDLTDADFDHIEKFKQRFYFLNGQATVTPQGIEFGPVVDHVWEDRLINRTFVRKPIIDVAVKQEDGNFIFKRTAEGRRCEFLTFLINTSNFWRKQKDITPKELREQTLHVISKVTAIGYLLNDYKFQTELRAIVAVDGTMAEVGQSNGRSGKSLVGVALSKFLSQTYIDGRTTTSDDQFMYTAVTPRTRNIFFDDAMKDFNYEKLFGAITGDLAVNPKNKDRFIIPNARSPKFYITTNHAIPTRSKSTFDRISFLIFSDWYSVAHSPYQDFGHQLFSDWDDDQWNLFDNFLLECNMLYQRSLSSGWAQAGRGVVTPPLWRILLRAARQTMGEDFLAWAEAYFDPGGVNLNRTLERKSMQAEYQLAVTGPFKPNKFRERLVAYCQFRGYHFNPAARNREGETFHDFIVKKPYDLFEGYMDKSGGKEFFTVATPQWAYDNYFIRTKK